MAVTIKLRRGLESNRLGVVFESGEIIFTTDEGKLYVGDGVTAGGNEINLTHISSDGTDHTYIDQDVTSGSAPTFTADNLSDGGSNAIITTTQETNFESGYTHVSNDGSDHSLIDQDVTSGAAPTFTADNLSDGGSNAIVTTTQETNFETAYTHVSNDGSDHTYIDQDVTITANPEFDSLNLTDNTGGTYTVKVIADSATMTDDRTLKFDVKDGNRLITMSADLTLGQAFTTAGSGAITLTTTGTTSLTLPTTGTLANETYVDERIQGLDTKDACKTIVTVIDLIVSGATYDNGSSGVGATITGGDYSVWLSSDSDDTSLSVGDRVLIMNEDTNQLVNGIYEFTQDGNGVGIPWIFTRTIDFDGSPANEVTGGCFTFIQEGTLFSDLGFVVSTDNDPIVVGTTAIVWQQFSGAGQIVDGFALTKTGNQLDVIPGEIGHNDLMAIDGGKTDEYYHLTELAHEQSWTVVSTATELLAAIANQDKNIYMKIGVYNITSPIALYSGLTILGEGNYLSDDGSAGVLIELETENMQGFTHLSTVSSSFGFSTPPERGDTILALDSAIGAILPAGDALLTYVMNSKNVAHILGTTTTAIDTTVKLHNNIPWDYTLSIHITPTVFKYITNIVKNISIDNISFSNPNAPGVNESIFIEGGTNINLKRIQTVSPVDGGTGGILLKSIVGVHLEEINGEYYNDNQALSLYGCAEVTLKNTGLDPEVEIADAYWTHELDACYNMKISDIRGTTLWLDTCTQFEISNYHREFVEAEGEDWAACSYFSIENSSIGNATVTASAYPPFRITTSQYFKIDNMHVRNTIVGTSDSDAAFVFITCKNYTVTACTADNAAVPIYHQSATNYKEFGNGWQGDVVHADLRCFGELYENNDTGGTDITVTTVGTYVQWVSTSVGATSGAGYVVGSATTDDLIIDADGEGDYHVSFKADCESYPGLCNMWAVFKGGSPTHIKGRMTSAEIARIPANGSNVIIGTTITGSHANVNYVNSIYHQIEEDNGTPAIDVRYYFTDPSESANGLIFNGKYIGQNTHEVEIEGLNITTVDDSGTAESGGNNTLTDTDKAWTTDELEDFLLVLTGGTGSGQEKRITSNDGTTITVESDWGTNPSDDTTYEVRGAWDAILSTSEDIPHTDKIDIEKRVEITGTLSNYYDSSSRFVSRIFHPSSGNTSDDLYVDMFALTNNKSVTHVSGTGILEGLVDTDAIDLRITCNVAGSVFTTKHINLNIDRLRL